MEEERWDKSGEEAESPIVPPHSIDAEKSVLGAVILSKDAAELASEKLCPDDFYYPDHRIIFSAMATLQNSGKPIDAVTVMD